MEGTESSTSKSISFDTEKKNHMNRRGIHNKVMIITNNNIFLL